MIKRAIENWLINTNERNYQIPFCQLLITQGYEILYISPHGPLEFGKDIISKDKNGIVHAYQLKTGNISLTKWRSIHGEIQDLINIPCDHPNIDKKIPHISHLVTNGEISDNVFQRIDKTNATSSNFSKLETINKDQLLRMFIEAQGEFIPQSFEDFQEFLSFFQLNGNYFFPKKKFFFFLKNKIFKNQKQKSNILNSISASVILTSYILKNFQDKKNYYAQYEAWLLLYSTIIGYINEVSITDKKIDTSLKLIKEEIFRNVLDLKEEFLNRDNLLEGSSFGDGDLVYRARATIILGLICCWKLYYDKDFDVKLHQKILENLKHLWYWGESSFPQIIFIIKYLEQNKCQNKAFEIINIILEAILKSNGFRTKNQAFPNPYYDINKILQSVFKNEDSIDYKQFNGSSYILGPLIEFIARRDLRELLEKNWRRISHMQLMKFIANKPYENFYYWNRQGVNFSIFPEKTQSWKKLQKISKKDSDNYKELKDILPLFLIVYPHRISEELIRSIDI